MGSLTMFERARCLLLLMPLVKLVTPTDTRWLSTLDAIGDELVSDSLVYRYKTWKPRPTGLRGNSRLVMIMAQCGAHRRVALPRTFGRERARTKVASARERVYRFQVVTVPGRRTRRVVTIPYV